MSRIKGIEVLKAQLSEFLDEILNSISVEMHRIGRPVNIEDFELFTWGRFYEDNIRLDKNGTLVLDISISELESRPLTYFISQSIIGHERLIHLLAMLKTVEGKDGKSPLSCRK